MRRLIVFIAMQTGLLTVANAQNQSDTMRPTNLKEVIIRAWMRRDVQRMPDEQNGVLFGGKKNEIVNISATNANIALKSGRQLFAKIPGVFVYDMDGSGNQVNIATRGLDANRSWEFNIRQNGVIINSDMYGFPSSLYSPPTESHEKIELVRGTGSLQYGAQFGGMLNYVTKKPDTTKPFSFESLNTVGSFGLLSTYNAVGGTSKKFSYYAYYHKRHSRGYRQNSESDAEAQFVQLQYTINNRASIKAEFGRSKFLYRIPGQLNDSMFKADPTLSTRSRNYFSPDIYVPSLTLDWKLWDKTKLVAIVSAVFGHRSSVMLDDFADVPDTINTVTGQFNNRQVDIDNFNSRTVELRILHQYVAGKVLGKLATGILYLNNNLRRRQLGKGTAGSDYELSLAEPGYVRDVHFRTRNVALFVENAFQFGPRIVVSPGARFENGISMMDGAITYYSAGDLPADIHHNFLLLGVSAQYRLNEENELYGGISQAYRPVLLNDVIPAAAYEKINKDPKNAFGYNTEGGVRGKTGHLQYDISAFSILYKNRKGTLVLQDDLGQSYIYRTNIGDSRTHGIEAFAQYKFRLANQLFGGLFTSTSYIRAQYITGEVSTGTTNKSISGNKVEAVPKWITRDGFELLYRGFACTILYSYTASSFSDALNTVLPSSNGARGIVPAYSIWDFDASLKPNKTWSIRSGINNIFNKQYYNKRPNMYPGAGIWPSDGRNVYITVGLVLE